MLEFDKHLLQTYLDRFCNRTDVYAKQYWSTTNYGYVPVWQPVTLDLIAAHLTGTTTAGWYCHDRENNCKWLAFDFDDSKGSRERVARALAAQQWRTIREGSRPGRDGHLWMFFDMPIPANVLRQFAKVFLNATCVSEKDVEIFPKQDHAEKLGNPVRGPLGIHHKPGAGNARGLFDLADHDLDSQLTWFAAQEPNSADRLLALAAELERRDRAKALSRKACRVTRSPGPRKGPRIDWCDYAEQNGFRSSGEFWHGPCPSCRLGGHDSKGNHMWVRLGGAAGCWRGCTVADIRNAIAD